MAVDRLYVHAKWLQSCPTFVTPRNHSPPGFSVHGDSPGNIGVSCHALLQGSSQPGNLCLLTSPALTGGFFTTSFPGGSDCKVSAYNEGDPGSIPGSGRSPGEGNGNPLQYSCLENPMDGGAW